MRIQGPRNTPSTPTRKSGRKTSSPDKADFSKSVDQGSDAKKGAQSSATTPVASVDALLSLQEAPDGTEHRSKGLSRARNMLDLLEDVRRGILLGTIPQHKLQKLATLARQRREGFNDPQLQLILDDIELRAEVELAKLES